MGSRVKPLIGITTSEVRIPDHVHPAAQSDPPRREMALGMKRARTWNEFANAIQSVIGGTHVGTATPAASPLGSSFGPGLRPKPAG